MQKQAIIEDELANSIDKARKQTTILFTDIVDSSRYWDQFGDIKGRMMVDRHNRLVFPVIRKFHGRVVKTIGDGMMAAFKRPNDALNAAIGIQQILKKMRDADRSFHAKVRIGLHTGMAIVEKNDIFGDVVNVAKRVESFGDANEIYLSDATAELLSEKKHAFHKKGSFIPKGKREPMTVYRCRWNEYRDLTRGLKINSDFPLDAREKGDIVAFGLIAIAVVAVMFVTYLRYLAADLASTAPLPVQLALLNPWLVPTQYPFVVPTVLALLLAAVLTLIWMKTIPYIVLRTLKGIAGFGLGFVLVYVTAAHYEFTFATGRGQEIGKTELTFVRTSAADAAKLPGIGLAAKNLYGFFEWDMIIPLPPDSPVTNEIARRASKNGQRGTDKKQIGVWAADNVGTYTPTAAYFRLLDLCAVCLGLMGFVSGFMNFHIDPR